MAEPIVVDIGAAFAALQVSPELGEAMNRALGLSERFYISRDNDLHWYVVPVAKKDQWEDFVGIDPEDDRAWNVPDWAMPVGGSPSLVTFTNPEIA